MEEKDEDEITVVELEDMRIDMSGSSSDCRIMAMHRSNNGNSLWPLALENIQLWHMRLDSFPSSDTTSSANVVRPSMVAILKGYTFGDVDVIVCSNRGNSSRLPLI